MRQTSALSKRRKERWVVLVWAIILTLLTAWASHRAFNNGPTSMDSFWAQAVLEGNTAAITEVIDYDFASQSRHGIFREVPGLVEQDFAYATSATAPDTWSLAPLESLAPLGDQDGTAIRVGDADVTISGQHRYQLGYSLNTLVVGDVVSWNGLGAGWLVMVASTELHLLASVALEDPVCFQGGNWSQNACVVTEVAPGHLMVKVNDLGWGRGITVTATRGEALSALPTLPVPPQPPASDAAWLVWVAPGVVLLGILLAAAATGGVVGWLGREKIYVGGIVDAAHAEATGGEQRRIDHQELAEMVTLTFAPPKGLAAHQGGLLLEESLRSEHKSAWILEQALASEIEIRSEDDHRVLVDLKPDRSAGPLKSMFLGQGELSLKEYSKSFSTGWGELSRELSDWLKNSDLWSARAGGRILWARLFGWVGTLYGVLAILYLVQDVVFSAVGSWEGFMSSFHWPALALGVGLALMMRADELRVRTAEGTGLWLQAEGFRRFLAESEAKHVEQAADQGRLREYTAWAVALGETTRWTQSMEAAVLEPTVYRDDLLWAQHGAWLMSDVSTASSPPVSSSSSDDFDFGGGFSGGGGSFGGSVGGGGGGGGGGDW